MLDMFSHKPCRVIKCFAVKRQSVSSREPRRCNIIIRKCFEARCGVFSRSATANGENSLRSRLAHLGQSYFRSFRARNSNARQCNHKRSGGLSNRSPAIPIGGGGFFLEGKKPAATTLPPFRGSERKINRRLRGRLGACNRCNARDVHVSLTVRREEQSRKQYPSLPTHSSRDILIPARIFYAFAFYYVQSPTVDVVSTLDILKNTVA